MVEVTVEEMKTVSSLTVGVLAFLFGISLAVDIITVQEMNEAFTYGLLAIATILIVSGIWKIRKYNRLRQ